MRVLLIHQAFATDAEPGGTRHFELAHRLQRRGITFTVIASPINYLTGRNGSRESSGRSDEVIGGIRLIRTYAHPSLHRSFGWRLFSFLTFMVSSVRAGLRAGPVDIVFGTSPPIFQGLSAWLVSVVRRAPLLFEVRDLWPQFAIELGVLKSRPLITLSRWLESFLYWRADKLLVNSPGYRTYLMEKGIDPSKIILIPNGVDVDMYDPAETGATLREELGLTDKFLAVYAGALGLANGIETIVNAAARLREDERIHFLIVGDGKERQRLERRARELQLDNICFSGAVSKIRMPEVLAASDVCLATLRDIPMFATTYPNKIFDYMAAGRPTVLAIDGVIRQVLEASSGGIAVRPNDDAALARAVGRLCDDRELAVRLGRNARVYVAEHFNRDKHAEQLHQLLGEIVQFRGIRKVGYQATKRIIDFMVAAAAIVLLAPVIAVLALLVRINLGAPVLFRQQRPGLNEEPFTILKFRTMHPANEEAGLSTDEARLSPFGAFLRSTSLDELPELINVLKGEMSLVGPRPLLMEYLSRYNSDQARRHNVKPGLTGWAQVNGRNGISWERKFELDLYYVTHRSLFLDARILLLTLIRILKREGITAEGEATMPIFTGSLEKLQ